MKQSKELMDMMTKGKQETKANGVTTRQTCENNK